jgi:hypothetical protein
MRKSPLLVLTLLVTTALVASVSTSCVVAAVGTGVVAGQVLFEDNTYIGHINVEAGRTWAQAKTTLSKRSTQPVDVDEAHRKIVADIDTVTVTATVETYDVNESVLRVSAKKYGFADNEMAKMMFDRITEDINRNK